MEDLGVVGDGEDWLSLGCMVVILLVVEMEAQCGQCR